MFNQIGPLLLIGFLWGATNPFIKKGSKGIVHIKEKNKIKQFIFELKYLFTNYQYFLPIFFNQMGSIFYFFALQNTPLSVAVPITNSLSFVFTAISGWILGETFPSKNVIFGILFIIIGSSLCIIDKEK